MNFIEIIIILQAYENIYFLSREINEINSNLLIRKNLALHHIERKKIIKEK